ncbi:MAG: hypothetical protein MUC90_06955 [Thermoplasmata archaeon]|jgi:hypothetical protein|nr:hypothetical protein [Thermoplasmata archaeon]
MSVEKGLKKVRRLAVPKPAPVAQAKPQASKPPEIPPGITLEASEQVLLTCGRCGAMIEFRVERCPLCGTDLEPGDSGILGLIEDLSFDDDQPREVDCPFCGEHVVMVDGRCPECSETFDAAATPGKFGKVSPVVQAQDIVYLHLDVESGDLDYVHKTNAGHEQLKINLSDGDAV